MKNARRIVKSTAANLLHTLSIDKLVARNKRVSRKPLIICYHRVVIDFADSATRAMPSLLVSADMFEKQLNWLAKNYRLVSLDEAMSTGSEDSDDHDGRGVASITFDDGYADFYWNAFPILRKYNVPSTIFVATDLVDTDLLQIHDELYLLVKAWMEKKYQIPLTAETTLSNGVISLLDNHADPFNASRYILSHFSQSAVLALIAVMRSHTSLPSETRKELSPLSWAMLRELSEQGVTIGSHTCSHALLPTHRDDRVAKELLISRLSIERELGAPVRHLAYPDGQFDERVARAAEKAGYSSAFTICDHVLPSLSAYSIPRKVLWENACLNSGNAFSPALLSCLVSGVFGKTSRCAQYHARS
jgi:peptidoglycan/xylan/chitin deacetylase (PgdA/CDA1 family)